MTITQADVAAWEAEKRRGTPCRVHEKELIGPDHPVHMPIDLNTDTGLVDAVELAKIDIVHGVWRSDWWWVGTDRSGQSGFDIWREAARAAVEAVIEQWKERDG